MRRVYSSNGANFEILGRDDTILTIADLDSALAILRRFENDAAQMQVIRSVVAEHCGTARQLTGEEILEECARLLIKGQIRLLKSRVRTGGGAGEAVAKASDQSVKSKPAPIPKTHWFEVKVVLDPTGDPLPNLSIMIESPDGEEKPYTTNSGGLIRLEHLPDGSCTIRPSFQGSTLANIFELVGLGSPPSGGPPAVKHAQPPPGNLFTANIDAHRVCSGDTLKSLAESATLTWQFLAHFNWGTDVPKEINGHLRDQVGCTKKTQDGKNYVFDDSDDPGIVYIPRVWEHSGLTLDQRIVVRVKQFKIKPRVGLIIPLEMDIDGDPLQDDEVRLRNTEGTWQKTLFSSDEDVEEDQDARLMYYRFRNVPEGDYEVAVRIAGKWTSVLNGITVVEDGATIGGRSLRESRPDVKVADPGVVEAEGEEESASDEMSDPGFRDQLDSDYFGLEDEI